MPIERRYCQAGLITYPDGTQGIIVAGGYYDEKSVDFLNLDTLIWEPRPEMPINIHEGMSVPYKDSFLIVGGYSTQVRSDHLDTIYYYNPMSDEFELLGHMMDKRETFAAFMVPDHYANCQ